MFLTSNIRSLVLASVIVTTSTQAGCMALLPKGGATEQQMLDSWQSTMYVVSQDAWLCPSAAAALAKTDCEGGRQVLHNRSVMVRGQAAKAGVWVLTDPTSPTPRDLFVAADQLHIRPSRTELNAFAGDVMQRYPEAKRIDPDMLNYADALYAPKKYAGRYLIMHQKLNSLGATTWEGGQLSFNLSIPMGPGEKFKANARFEFRNASIVNEFDKGQRSYRCVANDYCDEFIIVAEVTTRTIKKSDSANEMPVLNIVELADRFGSYRAD